MTREEYIKRCGASSAKKLTADQVLAYFIEGHGGYQNRYSASIIKAGGGFGVKIDRAKAIAMLRQAFEQDKVLSIIFIEGEGVVDGEKYPPAPHFQMTLRKS